MAEEAPLSASEIASYAVLLGINPATEYHLLWIAEEALTVELPPDWTEHYDAQSGNYYYHNTKSGDVQWVSPLEEHYVAVVVSCSAHAKVRRCVCFWVHFCVRPRV